MNKFRPDPDGVTLRDIRAYERGQRRLRKIANSGPILNPLGPTPLIPMGRGTKNPPPDFGPTTNLPTFEFPDGSRAQAPMRDANEYIRLGCRLVPRSELCPVRTLSHTFWDACSTEPA